MSAQQETLPTAGASTTPRLNLWPGAIVAVLGVPVLLMLVMVYVATSDRSFAVEPDYYQKALHWDDTAAQRRASAQLGWSAAIAVSDISDIYQHRDITCRFTDKTGNPIHDASVDVIAFSHARGSERAALTLEARGRGQYKSRMRISRPGLWEFRIVARRGAETFTQVQQLQVAPTGDSR